MNLPPGFQLDEQPKSSLPPGFILDGPPDGFADDIAPPQKQPGMFSRMARGAGQALDQYGKSQFGSPQDLLLRADQMVRSGANKAGELTAETLARGGPTTRPVNPNLAAAAGFGVSMVPDAVSTAAIPTSMIAGPKNILRPISRPLAQRSLGLTKRFLNTPFSRGKAAQAADAALDQKVISPLGNPKDSMGRAIDLQERSGQALGSMREAAGTNPIDPVFDSLEAARKRATGGMKGGAWDTVHRKFDEAQETLMGLLNDGPDVALAKVEQAKKLLSKTVNWVADNVSQETAKQISGAIESGVETIMRSKGIDMTAYATQKGLYGASKTMQKGLANEVAAQAGNNAVSLPTMVAGAGQLATGNVGGAMATVGLMEAMRRRGAGVGARLIETLTPDLTIREPLRATILGRSALKMSDPSTDLSFSPGKKFKNLLKRPNNGIERGSNRNKRPLGQFQNNGNEQSNQNNNNGNFQGQNNQAPPLDEDTAREYLKKAGGNKAKARKMAIADGWEIQ